MSKKFQWNPLTNSLEDTSNPSPHFSSSDTKKNDPTAGAVYTSKLDQATYPKAGTSPGEIVAAKKLSNEERRKQHYDKVWGLKDPPVTSKVQKLTADLEKVKKANEVLMKYGKPDKKFLENLEPVKFEEGIGLVGQRTGKRIDGMKEAVKMNDFVDMTDKKERDTLNHIDRINYETGVTPKPYWMEQEEKYKSNTRTPVQKKRDQFKAKQGGMAKTVKTNFGNVKIPGQPETKPEVKAEISQNTQMINDMEYLAKQRLESQILENKFHEIMKPQRDPDMSKGIASVDGAEVFKKTVDLADSKWRNKRNNRTNYGLNTILGEPK